MKKSIWENVRSVLAQGKDPVIYVDAGSALLPEPKKPGRPRKYHEPTEVEIIAKPLLGDSSRPRCLNPACRKRLRVGDRLYVCSEGCRALALKRYEAVAALLRDEELEVEDG